MESAEDRGGPRYLATRLLQTVAEHPTSDPPGEDSACLAAPVPSDGLDEARAVLRRVWGHDDFRDPQRAPLAAVLAGRDMLAILPTGGGKSLLYQVPALVGAGDDGSDRAAGLTLVVSPLVALMHDQVDALRRRGVRAALLDASLSRRQTEETLLRAQHGALRLLYVAPERIDSELFGAFLDRLPVRRLAVDEAHCVSAWGRHFRPAYLRLPALRDRLEAARGEAVPMLAVTASAPPDVRRDLLVLLGLRDPAVFVGAVDRPNLTVEVREATRRLPLVDAALRERGDGEAGGKAIVYAATRRSVEDLAARLRASGHVATAYHGGMAPVARAAAQAAWASGGAPVVVATNAFGMGVDEPDVRLVVHAEMPASLDAFVQEAGRGGRDGRPARALLLWNERDADVHRGLIEHGHPTAAHVAAVFDAMLNLAQVPVGGLPDAPVTVVAERVARVASVPAALVGPVLDLLDRAEVVRLLRTGGSLTGGGGTLSALDVPGLRAFAAGQGARLAGFALALLRAVPGDAATAPVRIDLGHLSRRVALPPERTAAGLAFLATRGLLTWTPDGGADGETSVVEVLVPRTPRLALDDRLVLKSKVAAERGLEAMLAFARTPVCRRQQLAAHYGDAVAAPCTRCDACRASTDSAPVTPADEPALRALLAALADGDAVPPGTPPRLVRHALATGWAALDLATGALALTAKGRTA